MVNEAISETRPVIATRIVFARAVLSVSKTREERLGGTDTRGGPLHNEESRGRLVGRTETGATSGGAEDATAELVDSDEVGARGGEDACAGGGTVNMGTGGRDALRADGGSDLRGGGGRRDDVRAGGGKDDEPARRAAGHGGRFVGAARTTPRSRTSDAGADDVVDVSRGVGALRFINFAVA
jgi:hypothetical protein